MPNSKIVKTIPFGDRQLTISTGEIARQATASVFVEQDGTVVLVTVVVEKEAKTGRDFFPLTVNYQERTYAAGKMPGGFMKREGRPTENETLVSRLIDRPLRPCFPKKFTNEVQVVATVMSFNPDVNPDILAIIGASAALKLSGVPFHGPVGAARVGYKDGIYCLNPSPKELAESKLDLVVAGTNDAVLMVESEADQLPERVMLGAVLYGHEMMQGVIKGIDELVQEAGTTSWNWTPSEDDSHLHQQVSDKVFQGIGDAYLIRTKEERSLTLKLLRDLAVTSFVTAPGVEPVVTQQHVSDIFSSLEKKVVRQRILAGETRIDGRDLKTVRPITVRTGLLPRTHGSALFTRGETQAIVTVTLGNDRDAQIVDSIHGESKERYMLHYNFPPYSVGEIGMMTGPKRREIGHGRLAKRGTLAIIPDTKEFPYVIRVVSEITESNGSSSMASVCGASLAMMDAGVPIKAPVAGIAMGLVKDGEKFAVLTDILGDEDHLGDMDFKVAGTELGITALQMDIKITGITKEIMDAALEQALHGRRHILGVMSQAIERPRTDISEFAPQIVTLQINPKKIGDVIGKGGATIRALTEETGVTIDIEETGLVKIFSADKAAADIALRRIKSIIEEVEVGKIYQGTITKLVDFGAFVNILPGKEGLLHISEIHAERIENVGDVLEEGQAVTVKVLAVDRMGRVRLSMKALLEEEKQQG